MCKLCVNLHICVCIYTVVHVCLYLCLHAWRHNIQACVGKCCIYSMFVYVMHFTQAQTWVCVCACLWSYSYQILLKAWFPQGNDRGHLIGKGWKQHLHPIGHTHDIKVLARQKHVKEIYIAVLTALQTHGHSPLPLPIIKATFIVCELHIPHYQ